jgi:photosystem I subunit PsaO
MTHLATKPVTSSSSAAAFRRSCSSPLLRRTIPSRPSHGRLQVLAAKPYPRDWIFSQPIVPVLAFFGWTIPCLIPSPAFGGKGLFNVFCERIADNLHNFPQGPALDDRFWLYFLVYHGGLFLTLLLGQIGVNGRKQGYFK